MYEARDRQERPPYERADPGVPPPELHPIRDGSGITAQEDAPNETHYDIPGPTADRHSAGFSDRRGPGAPDPEAARRHHEAQARYEQRVRVERSSAATYNSAVLASPGRLAAGARAAASNNDVRRATTYTMALHELFRIGAPGAEENLRVIWPEVAPMALHAAHEHMGATAQGVVDMGEAMLIDNLEPDKLKTREWQTKAHELGMALHSAASAYYNLSPRINWEDPVAVRNAAAVKAGFIYQRLGAAGEPVQQTEEQRQLYGQLSAARTGQLMKAVRQATMLPGPLVGELNKMAEQEALRREQEAAAQKVATGRGLLKELTNYAIKRGLTDYTRHPWRRR